MCAMRGKPSQTAGSKAPSAMAGEVHLGRQLLDFAGELVGIPSPSGQESEIANFVESFLNGCPKLEVVRIGDNVLARTKGARTSRVLLAGHLDTVPATGDLVGAHLSDGVLEGLGAVDMKAGLAVLLALIREAGSAAMEVTAVFYVCEEVERARNGLVALSRQRPDLLECDAAVLAEPTGGSVEAGCQGTLRLSVTLAGRRAHTARPWGGVNAAHRLGRMLSVLDANTCRSVTLEGCEFIESLQAVHVQAGVAGNVVPDSAVVVVNHRFAPDRSAQDAIDHVREVLASGGFDASVGDQLAVVDLAEGAKPFLDSPLLRSLVTASGRVPRAKLGWTDVAFFASRGTPAANFGPGDPSLAHSAAERVTAGEIHDVYMTLRDVLGISRETPLQLRG